MFEEVVELTLSTRFSEFYPTSSLIFSVFRPEFSHSEFLFSMEVEKEVETVVRFVFEKELKSYYWLVVSIFVPVKTTDDFKFFQLLIYTFSVLVVLFCVFLIISSLFEVGGEEVLFFLLFLLSAQPIRMTPNNVAFTMKNEDFSKKNNNFALKIGETFMEIEVLRRINSHHFEGNKLKIMEELKNFVELEMRIGTFQGNVTYVSLNFHTF